MDSAPKGGPESLLLFVFPALWLAFFGIAAATGWTSWGRSGHPSNTIGLIILCLFAAPFFGIAGCLYAFFSKEHYSNRMRLAAMIASICVPGAVVLVLVLVG